MAREELELITDDFTTLFYREKMRGQRGKLPVQPLGYVMSTKVIFRQIDMTYPGQCPTLPALSRYFLLALRDFETGVLRMVRVVYQE